MIVISDWFGGNWSAAVVDVLEGRKVGREGYNLVGRVYDKCWE